MSSQPLCVQSMYMEFCLKLGAEPLPEVVQTLQNAYQNNLSKFYFNLSNLQLTELTFAPVRLLLASYSDSIVGLDLSFNPLIMDDSVFKLSSFDLTQLQYLNLEKIGLKSSKLIYSLLSSVLSQNSHLEVLNLNHLSCVIDEVIVGIINLMP